MRCVAKYNAVSVQIDNLAIEYFFEKKTKKNRLISGQERF